MKLRLMTVFAAAAFVAACSSAPEDKGGASGGGAGSAGTSRAAPGPAPGSKEDFVVNVGDRVFFDFDKFALKPEARGTLEKQSAWLKKYGSFTATVEGHCDERGTREYNLGLGERRANSSKDYLVGLGIGTARMKTISYGKERPVALGHDEASWSQNRRAVTVLN